MWMWGPIGNDGSITELVLEIERAMERLEGGRDERQACQPSLASPLRQLSVRNSDGGEDGLQGVVSLADGMGPEGFGDGGCRI